MGLETAQLSAWWAGPGLTYPSFSGLGPGVSSGACCKVGKGHVGTTWEHVRDSAGGKEMESTCWNNHPGLASRDGPYSVALSGRLVASWYPHKSLIVEDSQSLW